MSARNESKSSVEKVEKSANELTNDVDKIAAGIINYVNDINNSDPTSWNIYQNLEHGVSFRYPQYYSKNEYSGSTKPNDPKLIVSFSAYNDEFAGRVVLMIFESDLSKSLEEVVNSLNNIQKNETYIAGKTGIKLTGISNANILSKKDERVAFIGIENNGKTFIIAGEDNDVLSKILFTVQF